MDAEGPRCLVRSGVRHMQAIEIDVCTCASYDLYDAASQRTFVHVARVWYRQGNEIVVYNNHFALTMKWLNILSFILSFSLSLSLSLFLSFFLSVFFVSFFLSYFVSFFLSYFLSFFLSISLFLFFLSLSFFVSLSFSLSLSLSLSSSFSFFLFLYFFLFLSLTEKVVGQSYKDFFSLVEGLTS